MHLDWHATPLLMTILRFISNFFVLHTVIFSNNCDDTQNTLGLWKLTVTSQTQKKSIFSGGGANNVNEWTMNLYFNDKRIEVLNFGLQ